MPTSCCSWGAENPVRRRPQLLRRRQQGSLIINLTSVAALEDIVDATVNPLRFRGNVYVTGWPAWSELDLVGKEVSIGAHARFKVVKRIVRCAATNVDPLTGIRDLNIPKALMRAFGHSDCGIYAEVTAAGEIATGNEIEIV